MADPFETLAPPPPLYDPDLIAAIRAARADLYQAAAERRKQYLLTGRFAPPKERDLSPVQAARAELDAARQLARETANTQRTESNADL